MIENMEYVIIQDDKALGMAVLSAEDTDKVCALLHVTDEDRSKVLLVCNKDYADETDLLYKDGGWAALNRPNAEDLAADASALRGALEATLTQMRQAGKLFENDAEWNQAIEDAEDALNRTSGRNHA